MRSSLHPWVNTVQYPFVTREHDTGEGWMSYVDAGRGRPVVFVHGSMTWSFLFRHLIAPLSSRHRCIAPDHLGFGLSHKPQGLDYGPRGHARRFADLMDHLRLEDVTLVVHDGGGPIALDWATKNPGRVRDLVLFNTWMWSLEHNGPAQRLARLIGNPFNKFYYRVLNASPSFILPPLFADRHRLPRTTQVQYMEPFRRHIEREGVYGMVEAMRGSNRWFDELWERRHTITDKRVLNLWGIKDPLFGLDALARMEEAFPNHTTVRYPTGRFIPEERPKEAADELAWFLLNGVRASLR
ncbi:alpha/beta fold hydrolase [bacterium]|nr:MAG: alpha/beta fold hydrolase [bacterium]